MAKKQPLTPVEQSRKERAFLKQLEKHATPPKPGGLQIRIGKITISRVRPVDPDEH